MRRAKAFTLVEVLVVIAVIALLMAILMPGLHRVKRMAKAVICRSNLRQWGLWYSIYTADNDNRFFAKNHPKGNMWHQVMRPYYKDFNDVLLCPMAMEHKCERHSRPSYNTLHAGNSFSSWARNVRSSHLPPRYLYGSYGLNRAVRNDPDDPSWYRHWRTTLVKSPGNVPVFLDCTGPSGCLSDAYGPRRYNEDMLSWDRSPEYCINRHDGHVNALFMDWTVRKVGLKELWTLKWHREFDTANEWTIAGGVKPEDWPEWMRKFKDY